MIVRVVQVPVVTTAHFLLNVFWFIFSGFKHDEIMLDK